MKARDETIVYHLSWCVYHLSWCSSLGYLQSPITGRWACPQNTELGKQIGALGKQQGCTAVPVPYPYQNNVMASTN